MNEKLELLVLAPHTKLVELFNEPRPRVELYLHPALPAAPLPAKEGE